MTISHFNNRQPKKDLMLAERSFMAFAEKLLKTTHTSSCNDRLLNAEEAGSLLGLQPGTMYDLVQRGQIDFIRLFGKTLRFRESVILKLIEDSEVKIADRAALPRAMQRRRKDIGVEANGKPSLRGQELGPEVE
jgi:excisionase family DNA binding protein